jgi:3-oxoacyl-[acyl-carrier protein] reductase
MIETKSDRTVIISGATKGLGKALSLNFARHGYQVVGLYNSDQAAAAEVRAEFLAERLKGDFIQQDVTEGNLAAVQPFLELAETTHLTLINNACATFAPQPLHLLKWEDFQSSFAVAVQGAWNCTQLVLRPMLKARRGNIVNVLSDVVNGQPPKGFAAYVTAKYALQGLTRALASEYSSRGVRVFSVSPGFMDTPLTSGWDERLKNAVRDSREGGAQNPATVAEAIRQLVESDETPGSGEDYRFD